MHNQNKKKIIINELKDNLNENEKNHMKLLEMRTDGYYLFCEDVSKANGILLRIKESRMGKIVDILKKLGFSESDFNDRVFEKNDIIILLEYVVNSHVLIPNFVLEGFVNKEENAMMINYYDYKTREFRKSKTKEYNAEYGYYIMNNENYLKDEFEDKMGQLLKKLRDAYQGKKIDFYKKDIQIIKEFFGITLCRNKNMVDRVNQESIMSKLIGDIDHNFIIECFHKQGLPNLFNDRNVVLLFNKTNVPFLLCDSLLYTYYETKDINRIIMPLSKKIAIALTNEKMDGGYAIAEFKDEETISYLNKILCNYSKEIHNNIIGDKEEIIKYI